jgi:nucleoside-diphosphate-sugar epimerase
VTTHVLERGDTRSLARLIRDSRPTIHFHVLADASDTAHRVQQVRAAAETITTTLAAVEAAAASGVARFALVTTSGADFADSPALAAERVAEMIVTDAALRGGREYLSVRAGGSFGVEGSLLRRWRSQLERGDALTMSDGEAGGPFITGARAAWLILAAAALREGGAVLELARGPAVPGRQLAADLVRASGRLPESVPIVVDGSRLARPATRVPQARSIARGAPDDPGLHRIATGWFPDPSFAAEVRMIIELGLAGREAAFRAATSALLRQASVAAGRRPTPDRRTPAVLRVESNPALAAQRAVESDAAVRR